MQNEAHADLATGNQPSLSPLATVEHLDADHFRCGSCGAGFEASIGFGSECPGGEVDHCSLPYVCPEGDNAYACSCGAVLTEAAICIAYVAGEAVL